jgi:hypothetical protein
MIVYMSSDGQGGDPEIYRMPASGGTPVQLTDDTAVDHFPDWGVAVVTPPETTAPIVSGVSPVDQAQNATLEHFAA